MGGLSCCMLQIWRVWAADKEGPMYDLGLQGRVALVTGAQHGIGAATARALADEGARVFIHYWRLDPRDHGISPQEAQAAHEPGLPYYHGRRAATADALLAEIRAGGGVAEAWECDLTDAANAPRLFERAEAALGPVEILVNNAAHYEPKDTIHDLTASVFDRTFDVNARASALLMAAFVARHRARGATWGRIVNLSTDAAQTFAGQITYGASKAAVEAFTRSVAIEVGALGITVNAVAPGPTQSGWLDAAAEMRLVPGIPLGRLGTPEDMADTIVFLASERAGWLTGQVIKVSGGHNL
jgi:3-oxoacyl-[acyl-carrier protein] reductase